VEIQTIKPATIIIVNDGSTDGSLSIVRGYQSTIPLMIIDKPNGGVSSARNAGIANSSSEFIAFLDADDEWVPHKLESMLKVFCASHNASVGAVFSRFILIDENGNLLPQKHTFKIDPKIRRQALGILLEENAVGSPSAVMVRRKCLDIVGHFDETLAGGEDSDLWLRIAEVARFDYVDEALVRIRKHSSNAQNNSSLMFKNQMFFYNKWVQVVNDRKLLRRWGRNLLVQLIIQLPNTAKIKLSMRLLSPVAKKKLFSIGLFKMNFCVIGFMVSLLHSFYLVFLKAIRYLTRRLAGPMKVGINK